MFTSLLLLVSLIDAVNRFSDTLLYFRQQKKKIPSFPFATNPAALLLRLCVMASSDEAIGEKETEDLKTSSLIPCPDILPSCFGSQKSEMIGMQGEREEIQEGIEESEEMTTTREAEGRHLIEERAGERENVRE